MYKTIIYNENCIPVLELNYLIEFDHFYCRGKYATNIDEIDPYFDVFINASKAELYQNNKILTTYWKIKYLQKIKCLRSITKKYKKNIKMSQKLYTGIIFFQDGQKPQKYRNISNLENFAKFGVKLGAWYVNLYSKNSGEFDHRLYF